jgi:DNA-binding transcriptional ArsR family regulator
MASGTNIKDYLWQIIVGTVSTVLGGVLLALTWTAVKAFFADVGTRFASVGAWLMGTTEICRVVMLAEFMVLAAFAWAALWWHRSSAVSAPVVAPVVAPPAPSIPAGFKPTPLQIAIILALMKRWQKQANLKAITDLIEDFSPELLPSMMAEAHISRELEALEAANVVTIDRLGTHHAYYHLTLLGRDWAIEAIKEAKDKLPAEGD